MLVQFTAIAEDQSTRLILIHVDDYELEESDNPGFCFIRNRSHNKGFLVKGGFNEIKMKFLGFKIYPKDYNN